MKSQIQFYSKIIFKNPLFVISLFFNLFLTYLQSGALESSIYTFTEVFCYGFISSNLFLLVSTSYIMYKSYDILYIYEKNHIKKQISLLLAGMLISLIQLFMINIFIFIYTKSIYGHTEILKGIFHFCIIWISSNLISLSIGISISIIIRNSFAIIISFFVYLLFPLRLTNLSHSIFYNLFNIFDDSTIFIRNNYDNMFNISYFIDKFFILILVFFILFASNFFIKNISKKKSFYIFSLLSILFIFTTFFYSISINNLK
ncbi:Uncharacterised protein [Clostridium perfringens]|uniref:Uncharacterized protein n=1 Tax=Clostridium perfringens TaxID=1502 RepID=A0A2X3HYK2_CLOPF|nr:hypothetical protein [Clostridium perfringens]MDH5079368.1 hypothetical protein [Clostridium perfringens]SQC85272.1 Uncharacterised protein [Clostridium perfringens]